jgi:hypothetical protein
MGPFDALLTGAQNFSQGTSPAANMMNFGLSMVGENPNQQSDAMTAGGMSSLSKIMETTQDPARAMLQYVQTPEGQQLMKSPGAFKKLTQRFQDSLQEPPLQSASIPQGAGGIIRQGPNTLATQGEYPATANTPAGSQTTFYGQNGPQGKTSTAPEDVQSFKAFADMASDVMPSSVMAMAAGYKATNGTPAQSLAFSTQLQQAGVPKEMADAFAYGRFTLTANPTGAPNYFLQDKWNPANIQTIWPQGLRPPQSVTQGDNGQPGQGPGQSVSPTYFGNGANPKTLGMPSTYDPTTGAPRVNPQGAASFSQPQLQVAQKYNVPAETVGVDGKINPLAAYGPGGLLALGSGLPAIIQDKASIVSQQLAPGDRTAMGEIVQQASVANEALEYLLLNSKTGAGRGYAQALKAVADLGTENESWSSATYGVKQLKTLRTVGESQIEINNSNIQDQLAGAVPKDPAELARLRADNDHWQALLKVIPPTPLLDSEEKAIVDGHINVATLGSAVSTVGKLGQGLAGEAAKGLGLTNETVPKLNADVDGTVAQINSAKSKADFKRLGQIMQLPGLDPQIKQAITQKFEATRKALSAPTAKGLQPSQYANPSQRGTPSVKQFTQNPTGTVRTQSGKEAVIPPPQGQSNAMYEAQPQGSSPFAGLGTSNRRVKNAFSAFQQ